MADLGPRELLARMAAYEAGKDCAINGPNTTNCHFTHFGTKERMESWTRGKNERKPMSDTPRTDAIWPDGDFYELCLELERELAKPGVLVPREPTEEMLIKGWHVINLPKEVLAEVYRAMLAAAVQDKEPEN